MPDARDIRDFDQWRLTLGAGVSVGEMWQMPDGRAAWFDQTAAGSTSEKKEFRTEGVVTVTKTNGVVILAGGRLFWDHSANSATFTPGNDRDFYIGTAASDAHGRACVRPSPRRFRSHGKQMGSRGDAETD